MDQYKCNICDQDIFNRYIYKNNTYCEDCYNKLIELDAEIDGVTHVMDDITTKIEKETPPKQFVQKNNLKDKSTKHLNIFKLLVVLMGVFSVIFILLLYFNFNIISGYLAM